MNTDAIWNKLLNTIKPKMSPLLFDTWFKDTKLLELNGEKAIVIVPTPAHKKHLSVMYNEMIEDIFNSITGTNFTFEYYLENEIVKQKKSIPVENEEVGVPYNSAEKANLNKQ